MNIFLKILDLIFPLYTHPQYAVILGHKYFLGVYKDKGAPEVGEGPFEYPVVVEKRPFSNKKRVAAFIFPNQNVGDYGPWWITPVKGEFPISPMDEEFQRLLLDDPLMISGIKEAIKNLAKPEKAIPATL